MKESVQAIIPCDLSMSTPVADKWLQEMLPLDCLLTSFTLECVCQNIQQYEENLHRFSSYLRPKGGLILIGDLEQNFYLVGKKRYFHFSLSQEMLVNALGKAGFSVVETKKFNYLEMGFDETIGNGKYGIFVAAVKQ